jgi:hypothetical protein
MRVDSLKSDREFVQARCGYLLSRRCGMAFLFLFSSFVLGVVLFLDGWDGAGEGYLYV